MKKYLLVLFVLSYGVSVGQNDSIQSLRKSLEESLSDSADIVYQIRLANQLTRRNVISAESLQEATALARSAMRLSTSMNYHQLRAQAIEELAYALEQHGEYDSLEYFYSTAFQLYLKSKDIRSAANCLNQLGIQKAIAGENDSALFLFQKVKELRIEINDSIGIAGATNNLGIMYYRKGEYMRSLEAYQNSLTLMELFGDKQGAVEVLTNIALIHVDRKDYHNAKRNYQRALMLGMEVESKPDLAILYNNIGDLYTFYDKLDSSLFYQRLSADLYTELGDDCGLMYPMIALGMTFLQTEQLDSANKYLTRGLAGSQTCQDNGLITSAMNGLGLLNLKNGDLKQSKSYLDDALQMATQASDPFKQQEIIYNLYLLSKEKSDDKSAIEYLELYQSMSDSIYSESLKNESARLEAEYEFKEEKQFLEYERESLQSELSSEKEAQHEKQVFMAIAFLIVSAILIILWRFVQIKQASNRQLYSLNQEIKDQNIQIIEQKKKLESQNAKLIKVNEEKNVLIGVVAHDLRTPLQNIIGLTYLIKFTAESLKEEEKTWLQQIDDSVNRLNDMIGNILNIQSIENQELAVKMEKIDVNSIVDDISSQFKVLSDQKQIQLHVHQAISNYDIKADSTYLMKVLENLISNAIKFSEYGKNINIIVSRSEDNKVLIEVQDEGPGISEADQKLLFQRFQRLSTSPTGGESSNGLGLSIVKKYMDAMGGEIYCKSKLGQGTSFFIVFPEWV